MNICYIITSTIKCGPVNVLFNTVKDYQKYSDFRPFIITIKEDDPNRSRREEFRNLGIKVVQFNPQSELDKIKSFIVENNIDIIHSHGLGPDILNRKLTKIFPDKIHMTTLHNFPLEDYVINRGKVKGALMSALQLWAIKDLYKVSCSEAIQSKFKDKLSIKTDVIENGVIYPDMTDIHGTLNNDRKVFLYLGDIHRRKNTEFLVDFFAKHPEYELWIVGDGDGEYFENVKQKAESINNVVMWGRTKSPSKYYKKADFLISDSYSEGLPMTVLESLSYGLPVILSDIPSHKEVLKKKNWGRIFKLDDEEDLGEKLREVSSSEFNNVDIFNQSKQFFSAETMMNNYVELYRKLMEGSND